MAMEGMGLSTGKRKGGRKETTRPAERPVNPLEKESSSYRKKKAGWSPREEEKNELAPGDYEDNTLNL